jgi:hypothetical protein
MMPQILCNSHILFKPPEIQYILDSLCAEVAIPISYRFTNGLVTLLSVIYFSI